MPRFWGYVFGTCIGKLLGDVAITHDEIEGLMADLRYTKSAPAGTTSLTDWLREHSASVGLHYSSELARRMNRTAAYENL
jgi:NADH dehydrogenase